MCTRSRTQFAMSMLLFKGTARVRFPLIWVPKFSQFVSFELRVGIRVLGMTLELTVIIIWEWPEGRSKLDSACRFCVGIRFTTPKSIRSGIFSLSLG